MKSTIFEAWNSFPTVFLTPKNNSSNKDEKHKIYNMISNQSFMCGPDKTTINNITNSTIKTLVYMIGIGNDNHKTLKTPYITNNQQTSYNGFNLSFRYDIKSKNIYLKIQKESTIIDITFCSIQKMFDKLVKKNPAITIKVIESLLIDGKMKFMFNVTEKDHGTKWIIKK